jgi:hypothetical protein
MDDSVNQLMKTHIMRILILPRQNVMYFFLLQIKKGVLQLRDIKTINCLTWRHCYWSAFCPWLAAPGPRELLERDVDAKKKRMVETIPKWWVAEEKKGDIREEPLANGIKH